MNTKDELDNALKTGKVEVLFVKPDGTLRNMVCTLLEEFTNTKLTKEVSNSKFTRVFDLEKNDWRTIKYDSIKTMKVIYD